MRKKNNQLVTVDVLEAVLDKRFEQFGKQITTQIVSQLIEYIDIRVGAVEMRLNHVEKRVDNIERALDWLVNAYKKFEEEHMILTSKYTSVQHRLDNHEERLIVLEK